MVDREPRESVVLGGWRAVEAAATRSRRSRCVANEARASLEVAKFVPETCCSCMNSHSYRCNNPRVTVVMKTAIHQAATETVVWLAPARGLSGPAPASDAWPTERRTSDRKLSRRRGSDRGCGVRLAGRRDRRRIRGTGHPSAPDAPCHHAGRSAQLPHVPTPALSGGDPRPRTAEHRAEPAQRRARITGRRPARSGRTDRLV